MATTTANLGLTLPAVSDPADITPINENFQKLDTKVGLNARSTDAFAYQNASLTDLLTVRLDGNFDDLCMSHTHISTEDATTLHNSPITSGPFYAIRKVNASPVGHVFVTLEEFYPVCGRVWTNMYDKNFQYWLGWQVNGNPPMLLGVEYCTTERYKGNAVYCKLVDCGTLPNATVKTVACGISDASKVVDYKFMAYEGTNSAIHAPGLSGTNGSPTLRVAIANGYINMFTMIDMSPCTGVCMIKYVK